MQAQEAYLDDGRSISIHKLKIIAFNQKQILYEDHNSYDDLDYPTRDCQNPSQDEDHEEYEDNELTYEQIIRSDANMNDYPSKSQYRQEYPEVAMRRRASNSYSSEFSDENALGIEFSYYF